MNTSIWRRLNAVRRTYATRITFWIVTPIVILLLIAAWSPSGNQHQRLSSVKPQPDRSGSPSFTAPELLLREKDSIRYLAYLPQQTLPPGILKQLSNLRGLALYSPTSAEVWREATELSELRSLEIVGDLPSEESVPSFAKWKSLQFLSWSAGHSAAGLKRLAAIPNLDTLDITGAWPHRDMDWPVLGEFRSVRTLVISGMSPKWVKPEIVQALRSIPNLRRLYVADPSNKDDPFAGFETLRRELPGIEVRPSEINPRRLGQPTGVFAVGIVMFVLGLLHLPIQFGTPAANLTPGFAGPHMFVAAMIWLIVTGLACGALWSLGNPWWTSLSVALLPTALPGLILLNLQNPYAQRTRLQKLSMMLVGVVMPLCCFAPLFIAMQPGLFDWYLRGEMPLLAGLIGLGSLAITLAAGWRLMRLYPVMQEMGLAYFPISMDVSKSFQMQNAAIESCGSSSNRAFWMCGLQSRRLERFVRGDRPASWLSEATRWIRPNYFCGQDSVWFIPAIFGVMISMGFLFSHLTVGVFAPEAIFRQSFFAPIMTISSFVIGVPMALQWFSRQRLLGYESMRPITRQQYIREMWTAVIVDQIPPFLMQATLIAGLSAMGGQSWSVVALAIASLTLPWLMVIAWLLIGLSIRPSWRLFVVFCLAYVTTFTPAGITMTLLSGRHQFSEMPYFALGCLLLAIVLLMIARYRWQRLEFGALT